MCQNLVKSETWKYQTLTPKQQNMEITFWVSVLVAWSAFNHFSWVGNWCVFFILAIHFQPINYWRPKSDPTVFHAVENLHQILFEEVLVQNWYRSFWAYFYVLNTEAHASDESHLGSVIIVMVCLKFNWYSNCSILNWSRVRQRQAL